MCLQKLASNYADIKCIFKSKESLDITDHKQIITEFGEEQLDYCINCAAYTNVEEAERNPDKAFAVNSEGVKKLAEACHTYKVKLIHISSDYVFDGEKKEGYLPSDTPNPINEYGRSKLEGESHIRECAREYLIVRTSWLYSEFGHNFYKSILAKAKKGETIFVTDAQTGCPTNANHLARYLLDIISNSKFETGIKHFTDGVAMSWYEFALRILEEHKLQSHAKVVRDKKYRSFVSRPKNSVLNRL
jgi:dTDP-4-dehydrorhamnose reductase